MNFKLKLATAVAALALSGGAFAQYVAGDILVDVYDPVSGAEIAFDTGVASSATVSPYSHTLSTLSGWSTFSSAVTAGGGSLSSLDFVVFGNTSTKSGKSTIYNVDFGASGITSVATPNLIAAVSQVGSNIVSGNNANSPAFWLSSGGIGSATGTNINGALGASGVTAVGTEATGLNLYYVSTATSATPTAAIDTMSLSNTTFSINAINTSPTPEPGSYALMAAGLLAVGAIARRRGRA